MYITHAEALQWAERSRSRSRQGRDFLYEFICIVCQVARKFVHIIKIVYFKNLQTVLEEIVIIKLRPFRIPNPAICFRDLTEFHISIAMYRTVVGSLSITASRNLQIFVKASRENSNDFTVPQSHNFNILNVLFLIVADKFIKI
jgi:hypothetical protein